MNFQKIDFEQNLDICVRFREDSYRASFPGSDDWVALWDEQEYRAWVVGHAERFPDGALHVVEDGKIIGQLEFAYFEESGYVNLFYLEPGKRSMGYGTALHDYVLPVLGEKGCVDAALRVSPRNLRAIRFYEKHGWTDRGPCSRSPQVHVYDIKL